MLLMHLALVTVKASRVRETPDGLATGFIANIRPGVFLDVLAVECQLVQRTPFKVMYLRPLA